jgi:ketosteroid isomerase-like protein
MKRLFTLVGFVCLIAMLLPTCAPALEPEPEPAPEPVFDQAAEEAAIREVFDEFKLTYNNHDVEVLPSFFLDDSLAQWTNETKGAAAIEKLYTGIFERGEDIHAEMVEDFGILFLSPTVALWRGTGEYTGLSDADGNPGPPRKNRGALVFVKKEGQWRMAAMFERPMPE